MIKIIYSFLVLLLLAAFTLNKNNNYNLRISFSHQNNDSTIIYLRFPDLHQNYLKVYGNDSICFTEMDRDSLSYNEIKGKLIRINDSIYYTDIYDRKIFSSMKDPYPKSDTIHIYNNIFNLKSEIDFILPGNKRESINFINRVSGFYSKIKSQQSKLKNKTDLKYRINTNYINPVSLDTVYINSYINSALQFKKYIAKDCGFYIVFTKTEVYSMSYRDCYKFRFTSYIKPEKRNHFYILK